MSSLRLIFFFMACMMFSSLHTSENDLEVSAMQLVNKVIERLEQEKDLLSLSRELCQNIEAVKLFFETGQKYISSQELILLLIKTSIEKDYLETFKILIYKTKTDINLVTKEYSFLCLAAYYGCKNIVIWLLDQGANMKPSGKFKRTPLHCAALGGHSEIVELLLSRGALISDIDDKGYTALNIAQAKPNSAIIVLLENHRAKLDAHL